MGTDGYNLARARQGARRVPCSTLTWPVCCAQHEMGTRTEHTERFHGTIDAVGHQATAMRLDRPRSRRSQLIIERNVLASCRMTVRLAHQVYLRFARTFSSSESVQLRSDLLPQHRAATDRIVGKPSIGRFRSNTSAVSPFQGPQDSTACRGRPPPE